MKYSEKNNIIKKISNILESYNYFYCNDYKNFDFKKVYYIESIKSIYEKYETKISIKILFNNSFLSEVEMIILSIKILLSLGIYKFYFNIGYLNLVNVLLDNNIRNVSLISKLLNEKNFLKIKNDFCCTKNLIDNIEKMYNILFENNLSEYIYFDLCSSSINSNMNFYCDINKKRICQGRKVDSDLIEYEFNINNILYILNYNKYDKRVLIGSNYDYITTAYKFSDIYRKKGMIVENSFIIDSFEKNFEYAKNNNISNLLYFVDDENIIISSLEDDGYTIDATINDLI